MVVVPSTVGGVLYFACWQQYWEHSATVLSSVCLGTFIKCQCHFLTLLLSVSTQSLIRCYCYEKYYNHAANAAAAAQRKLSSVPICGFYHAYAKLMQGELCKKRWLKESRFLFLLTRVIVLPADQIDEASVELETIRDSRDVSLCTLMALVYAEKKKSHPGKAAGVCHS